MSTRLARGMWFVGGLGLLAAWLAAAASDRPQQPAAETPAPTSSLDRAEQLAREIQAQSTRMRDRLAAAPRPRDSGRNPFAFQERRSAQPEPRVRVFPLPAESGSEPAADALVEPLPFALNGIAEDGTGEALVRTAVLSGFGDIVLARTGDTLGERYEVVGIDAAGLDLRDLRTGRSVRLALR